QRRWLFERPWEQQQRQRPRQGQEQGSPSASQDRPDGTADDRARTFRPSQPPYGDDSAAAVAVRVQLNPFLSWGRTARFGLYLFMRCPSGVSITVRPREASCSPS